MSSTVPIGILTVSDRAAAGIYEDRGGPGVVAVLTEALTTPWHAVRRTVPDERDQVEAALIELTSTCPLVVTTGGTGPATRDITPDATEAVCDRLLPGFGELMRTVSLAEVPTAILSRQVGGTRGASLIVNLPGSPRAIRTCLLAVLPAVPYAIDLVDGPQLDTDPSLVPSFRPQHSPRARG